MQSTGSLSVCWVGPRKGEAYRLLAAQLSRNALNLGVCEPVHDPAGQMESLSTRLLDQDNEEGAALADALLEALASISGDVLAERRRSRRKREGMVHSVRRDYS